MALLLGSAVTTACVSPVQLYPGDRLADSEIGIVRMVTNGSITSINSHPTPNARAVEMLPGPSSIDFRVIIQGTEFHSMLGQQRKTVHCSATVLIQPGHQYQITRSTPTSPLVNTGDRKKATQHGSLVSTFIVEIIEVATNGRRTARNEADCSV